MKNNKEQLIRLTSELIALGENKLELDFWVSCFGLMNEEEQDALLLNLSGELEKLKK